MTLSSMKRDDDFFKVIRLIYQTDNYIYPLICGNDYVYFEKIMLHHLNTESIFSYKNIITAQKNGEIAGIILTITKEQPLPPLPANGEFEMRECYCTTINDYFQKLVSGINHDWLYINNLCVDKGYQRIGVGYALLQYTIENSSKNKIVLDCLADNLPAITLYKKCGFDIVDSFDGYSGTNDKSLKCLKLEKSRLCGAVSKSV